MAVNEVSRNGPEIISRFARIRKCLENVWVVETLLILQENLFDVLLELFDSRIKVDVLCAWSPPEGSTVPSATGNM